MSLKRNVNTENNKSVHATDKGGTAGKLYAWQIDTQIRQSK